MSTEYEDVTPQEAAKMIERGECYVIDVRTPPEFARHRIAGAHLLPVQELQTRHVEIPRTPDKKLLIYCEHGVRSAGTCRVLVENGWSKVVNMLGGMDEYVQAGLPYATGSEKDALYLGPPQVC